MIDSNYSDDEVFLHLSHRPRYILDSVISVDESKNLAFTLIRRECQSSLGQLDNIALETLHDCLGYLDLQSLWRLSRVSLRGKAVVESLSEYGNLVTSVGHTFKILKRAKILAIHSITTLHAALTSLDDLVAISWRMLRPPKAALDRATSIRLTSVKAAKELALKEHGPIDTLATKSLTDLRQTPVLDRIDVLTWFR
ncbi:hypothetical protein BU16DRAFT_618139 [Lophium mytilinum]|uniref:F-box domain-containing protein n=1 Tax=Lophium mytilinum TaxID=390894 RepID=A0A6A6QS09_9PEZI|nr:hypothetical protein BU16DRAFT_618139 [Lophium mytilinum]